MTAPLTPEDMRAPVATYTRRTPKLKTFPEVAVEMVNAASELPPDEVLLGNVTVGELAAFVFIVVGGCPACKTARYTNTECAVCHAVQEIVRRHMDITPRPRKADKESGS